METATTYTPSEPQATLRIGRQQALERWAAFIASVESILKSLGGNTHALNQAIGKALLGGSLEASLPHPLIEEELRKLVPFTLKDFWGMCQDDKNWTYSSNNGNNDGPIGLRAERLAKIAYSNGGEFKKMYEAFCGHRVFGKPVPECPAE